MFKWISQFIQGPGKAVLAGVDRINAALQGGPPRPVLAQLGTLSVPSRSITLEDPQGMPHGLEISDLASNTAKFSADLLRYPNGVVIVATLNISFSKTATNFPKNS